MPLKRARLSRGRRKGVTCNFFGHKTVEGFFFPLLSPMLMSPKRVRLCGVQRRGVQRDFSKRKMVKRFLIYFAPMCISPKRVRPLGVQSAMQFLHSQGSYSKKKSSLFSYVFVIKKGKTRWSATKRGTMPFHQTPKKS